MAVKWKSRQDILGTYELTEPTLEHLIDLELFVPEESRVNRGVRQFKITPEMGKVFEVAKCHYDTFSNKNKFLMPCQRAVVFYLLTVGPKETLKLMRERKFFFDPKRPSLKYLEEWLSGMVKAVPKELKAWVSGEQTEPDPKADNTALIGTLLTVLGIEEYFDDPDLADLPLIYHNFDARCEIESLLHTKASYSQIQRVMEQVHDLELSIEDIKTYHHLYFDHALCGYEGCIAYFRHIQTTEYAKRVMNSRNMLFNKYVRHFQIPFTVESVDMLDDMILVEQNHYQRIAALSRSGMEDFRMRSISVSNTLALVEAKKAIQPNDGLSEMDRLMLEFDEPTKLEIVKREDIDPGMIDGKNVIQASGHWASAEEIEDDINKRTGGTGS